MGRVLPFVLVSALFFPGRANALTLRDLMELSRAGLGDEVLLALIEVDRPVFSIDPATLKSLKTAGVSERVIVAVVRSGRVQVEPAASPELQEPPAMPELEPRVIVIEHHDAQPQVREVAVAVPVYIPVVVSGRRDRGRDGAPRAGEGERDLTKAPEPKRGEPKYWGWGGKRRPDAWQEQK